MDLFYWIVLLFSFQLLPMVIAIIVIPFLIIPGLFSFLWYIYDTVVEVVSK